jgi:tRNA (guanosine-2'-O-)-methyltransferase
VTIERYSRIAEVLRQRQPDLTVVTDCVHKGQNLSAIVRTCDAVGVMELHSVSDDPTFRTHTGTTVGAHKWVNTTVYSDISEPLTKLKNEKFQIVAADISEQTKDYREIDYTVPTALVLGAEKYGISAEAKPYIDHSIGVPMSGMVESLNVSVASAIILSEARRQRELAGFYNSCRLDANTYNKMLFEWMQPLMAKYCQKQGVPYPELDEDGDIADPNWHQSIEKSQ